MVLNATSQGSQHGTLDKGTKCNWQGTILVDGMHGIDTLIDSLSPWSESIYIYMGSGHAHGESIDSQACKLDQDSCMQEILAHVYMSGIMGLVLDSGICYERKPYRHRWSIYVFIMYIKFSTRNRTLYI